MRDDLLAVAVVTHACDHRRKRLLRPYGRGVARVWRYRSCFGRRRDRRRLLRRAAGRGEHGVAAGGHALAEAVVVHDLDARVARGYLVGAASGQVHRRRARLERRVRGSHAGAAILREGIRRLPRRRRYRDRRPNRLAGRQKKALRHHEGTVATPIHAACLLLSGKACPALGRTATLSLSIIQDDTIKWYSALTAICPRAERRTREGLGLRLRDGALELGWSDSEVARRTGLADQ